MSHYEGIVRVSVRPANNEELEKLKTYTQDWIKKARRYAKPDQIDKNTWLLESDWTPGTTMLESELVNKNTATSVRQYLQGIIEQGIDASFKAEIHMADISGADPRGIDRTYTSEKMLARLKK